MSSKKITKKYLPEGITLTDKRARWCEEYYKSMNATQSYMTVYDCTEESARTNVKRLLKDEMCSKYIQYLISENKKSINVEIADIVTELKSIAFDEKSKNSDKLRALEMLAKYKGMFNDTTVQVTNNTIVISVEDDDINDEQPSLMNTSTNVVESTCVDIDDD